MENVILDATDLKSNLNDFFSYLIILWQYCPIHQCLTHLLMPLYGISVTDYGELSLTVHRLG